MDVAPLVKKITVAAKFGREHREVGWGGSAGELWEEVYEDLSEGEPGLFGAATSRAEAQTVRLAALYATLDRSPTIELAHLKAALALWDYAEASALLIFGNATGDAVADRIVAALKEEPGGLTRTDLYSLFKRHKSRNRIDLALALLVQLGRVRSEEVHTGGRPAERWFLK